jgi:hypothetical protein
MSYDSKVEGALWLEPFPDAAEAPALREALPGLASPAGGRLVLTPLGHGLVLEDTFDWLAAVELIERAKSSLFGPRGIAVGGTLRAIGEDGAHLATISIDAAGTRVEEHRTELEYGESTGEDCGEDSDGGDA